MRNLLNIFRRPLSPYGGLPLGRQILSPEMIKGMPLAMSSYKWLFNSSRIPEKPSDTARKYDASKHNHVVFVRKNKFFEVPVVVDGTPLGSKELEAYVSGPLHAHMPERLNS